MSNYVDIAKLVCLGPEKKLESYRLVLCDIMAEGDPAEQARKLRGLLIRLNQNKADFAAGKIHDDFNALIEETKVQLFRFHEYLDIDNMTLGDGNGDGLPEALPDFGMPAVFERHWADVYRRLTKLKPDAWLVPTEVSINEWVHVCCGKREPVIHPLVWHGGTATLAYIVRTYFKGQWEIAHQVFVLPDKALPKTFKNTKAPVPETRRIVDDCFRDSGNY